MTISLAFLAPALVNAAIRIGFLMAREWLASATYQRSGLRRHQLLGLSSQEAR
jgi:hypothetical protein